MPSPLVELQGRIDEKRERLSEVFKQAGAEIDLSKVTAIAGTSAEKVDQIRQMNDELDALVREREQHVALEKTRDFVRAEHEYATRPIPGFVHPSGNQAGGTEKASFTSLGDYVVKSDAYLRQRGQGGNPRIVVDVPNVTAKTLMSTTAGFAPANDRTNIVIPSAQRRVMVPMLIPSDDTDLSAIRYMEETTFTNNAAAVAEGGTKPESALAYTERTVPVEVIATWLPVTRQQIDDVVGMRALVDNRLTLMLQLEEEDQILNGNGTSPQLIGFYNKAGIQTQAKGADPTADAIYKALTKVRHTGFADPTAIILHPNDWQDIRLTRTTDGIYIWGSPAEAGPERIWGLPVVATTAATENTGLVGDFGLYSHISRKMGITIDVSDSHSDYFIKNQLAIRIESRLCLEIYRASAFCTITSI